MFSPSFRASSLVPVLGLIAACGGGGSDESGPSPKEFAYYWADTSAWCSHQAECTDLSKADCEDSAPMETDVEAAIKLARLTPSDLERCQEAGKAWDKCFDKAECDVINDGSACPDENERLMLDCAALIKALDIGAGGGDSGGAGDGDSGDAG